MAFTRPSPQSSGLPAQLEHEVAQMPEDPPPRPARTSAPAGTPPGTEVIGEVVLPGDERAARQAERILAATLDVWGLDRPGRLRDATATVLGELVANAVRHSGGGEVGVTLRRRLTLIQISVRDASRALPCLHLTGPPSPDRP